MRCTVEGCDGKIHAHNMCQKHYRRYMKYGDSCISMQEHAPRGEPLRFLHEEVLVYKGEDCLWWPYARNSRGYGHVTINRVQLFVHVVICETLHGPRPSPDHVASHLCGKGHLACCNPKHLKWQTRIEDQVDKVIHGTSNRGEQQGSSVLSEKSVLEIRSLEGKLSQRKIAKLFGVSQANISAIMLRRSWSWLR